MKNAPWMKTINCILFVFYAHWLNGTSSLLNTSLKIQGFYQKKLATRTSFENSMKITCLNLCEPFCSHTSFSCLHLTDNGRGEAGETPIGKTSITPQFSSILKDRTTPNRRNSGVVWVYCHTWIDFMMHAMGYFVYVQQWMIP